MERKTKHRILGILVVVGLVIISLPFFQGSGRDSGSSLVNAPAFPDQPVQVEAPQTQVETTKSAAVQSSPIPIQDPSADTGINQLPDDTIAPNSSSMPVNPPQAPSMTQQPEPDNGTVVPNPNGADNAVDNNQEVGGGDDDEAAPAPEDPTSKDHSENKTTTPNSLSLNKPSAPISSDKVMNPANTQDANKNTENLFKNSIIEDEPVQPIAKTVVTKKHSPLMHSAALKPKANDMNGLLKLKKAGWVIQLGSFKNKENALRLVNKLRLKGYHAFVQQTASRTKVFVGPEDKQPIARMVASQLEEEMHINGVVVSYKPLAL